MGGGDGVERAGRLVAKQQIRVGYEGSGYGNPLLLAAGKLAGTMLGALRQPYQPQYLGDPLVDLGLGGFRQHQGDRNILRNCFRTEQIIVLKHHGHGTPQRPQVRLIQRRPQDRHAARTGSLQPIDGANQRGFARAGGPHHTEDTAGRHIKGHRIQGGKVTKNPADLVE